MYRKRQLLASLSTALTQFPAVLITGPRQSGKTTFLMNELGSEFQYVSLDDPLSRDFAIQDPNGFLAQFEDAPSLLKDTDRQEPQAIWSMGIDRFATVRIDAECK
jgi:hypothetical protein